MQLMSVDIQGFHNVIHKKYEFDNFNYISGPNGSGKSTVINAIQFALFGYIAGPAKNSNEALFKHSNSDKMSITLTISDGDTIINITRSLYRTGSKILSQIKIVPEGYSIQDIVTDLELPVFNFQEFIGMTSNKLKDWFIDFLPKSEIELDWSSVLSDEILHSDIVKLLDESIIPSTVDAISEFNLSGVAEIRKANEYIKSCMAFTKQTIQRTTNTIQSLVYYDDFVPTRTASEIQAEIAKLNKMKREQAMYSEYNIRHERLLQELDELKKYDIEPVDVMQNKLSQHKAQLSEVSAKYHEVQMQKHSISSEISSLDKIIVGSGLCPYSESRCPTIASSLDDYRLQRQTKQDNLNKLKVLCDSYESQMQNISNTINS